MKIELVIFLIIYFQIGLGNAIGSNLLNKHEINKITYFILDLFLWPVCVGLSVAKGSN